MENFYRFVHLLTRHGTFRGRCLARLIIGLSVIFWTADGHAGVRVGDPPPDYLGVDFKDHPVRVTDYPGKIVIVTFWASWCAPCRSEMSILENLQSKVGADRIKVIAVNFNESEQIWRAMKMKLAKVTLTVTHDRSNRVTEAFDVHTIPHMYIVDKSGHVAFINVGYNDDSPKELVDQLNELLLRPSTSDQTATTLP